MTPVPSKRALWVWLALTLGMMSLLAVFWWQRAPQSSPARPAPTALLVNTRERLEICVTAVAGAKFDQALAISAIYEVLSQFSQSPKWSSRGLNNGPPNVVAGCDQKPVVLMPDVVVTRGPHLASREIPSRPVVATPSPYIVIIFVMPDDKIDEYFYGYSPHFRTEWEEKICEAPHEIPGTGGARDRTCFLATMGLYLKPLEAVDIHILQRSLAEILGV